MVLARSTLLAAAVLVIAGCGDEAAARQSVGKVTDPGSDAVVGMVSDGERVQLYLCGGPSSYAALTRWFQGPVGADGSFSIASGDFVAEGDAFTGEGVVKTDDGRTLAWQVDPASGDLPGLYAAMDGSCRTGVVVGDFDGDGALDLQGTWCDGKDLFAQVTPIMPIMPSARGIAVTALTDPPRQLWVDRVRQP